MYPDCAFRVETPDDRGFNLVLEVKPNYCRCCRLLVAPHRQQWRFRVEHSRMFRESVITTRSCATRAAPEVVRPKGADNSQNATVD